MNKYYIIILCFVTFLMLTGAVNAVLPDEDILISKNIFGNYWTCIDGDKIVWLSEYESYEEHPVYADAKYRIIVHNITSGDEVQILTKSQRPESPSISGRYVVWSDYIPGGDTGYDIYCHDLETNITKVIAGDYGDQKRPVIAGDVILWNELSGSSMQRISKTYLYNFTEDSISDISISSGDSFGTVTDGKIILFSVSNDTSSKIYTYDLQSKEKQLVYQNACGLWSISVSGDNAAWIEVKREGRFINDYTIKFYNLKSKVMQNFSAGSVEVSGLNTDGNLTIFRYGEWAGTYNKNGTSIWIHDYETDETFPLIKRDYNQAHASISDGKIVWQDCSFKNSGIYLRYYGAEDLSLQSVNSSENTPDNQDKNTKTPGFCFIDSLAGLIATGLIFLVRKR